MKTSPHLLDLTGVTVRKRIERIWEDVMLPEKILTIDLDRIREFDGFDEDSGEPLVSSILKLYLEVAPQYISAIRAGVEAGNASEIRRASHNLKSSSANIGATKLSKLCAILEHKTEPEADTLPSLLKTSAEQIFVEFPLVERDVRRLAQLPKGAPCPS